MAPDARWRRIQELCERMETLPEAEREAFLAQAEPDEGIRAEARALLQSLASESEARAAFDSRSETETPTRIGEYTITGQLGRGGTSTVYAAERTVNGVVQPVALKLLHSYLLDPEDLKRFQREQAILVRLDHPAICRVLDAGVTAARQPYLVLERVHGQPIDQYAKEHRLPIADRIRLIVSACDAIAAAHRNLVVHLDLKPSNLFITADGHVCLLDFGTAKLIDPVGSLTTTRYLTPLYAAPEQLRGEPVSTACDVYSLGMVLYELLAGANPFGGVSLASVAERAAGASTAPRMAERITEQAARDRGITINRLRAALAGDIDRVVAKALAADPKDRYATIADFADDLRRYLENRPVLARRQTTAYRLRKYASRHRALLAVTALLLLTIAGATLYGWRERQRALEQGRRAQASSEFLVWLISSSNPIYGGHREMTVRELLQRADQRLARGDLQDETVASDLETNLGAHLFQSGQESRAVEVLERAHARAQRAGSPSAQLTAAATLGSLHLSRGDCAQSTRISAEGDRILATHRNEVPVYRQVSYLLNRDQIRASCEGDPSGNLTKEAVALLPQVPDSGLETGMPAPLFKALILNGYIRLLVRQAKPAEAITVSQEALRLADRSPDGRNIHIALLQSRAAAEYAAKDVAAAARSLDEAVTLAESSAAPFEAIRLKVMAGQRLAEAGNTTRALALADQAVALASARAAELTQTRWMILIDAAITYFRAGHCEKASPLLAEADRLTGGKMPPQWKGNRLAVECICLARAGKPDQAKARAAEALAAAGATWSPTSTFRRKVELVLKTGKD
ncbi:MAG: serine/threonine protein kinase [Bryobacterales bacterium]|nr:serine/threonine protein kinase [Bryobacterales bacterium]